MSFDVIIASPTFLLWPSSNNSQVRVCTGRTDVMKQTPTDFAGRRRGERERPETSVLRVAFPATPITPHIPNLNATHRYQRPLPCLFPLPAHVGKIYGKTHAHYTEPQHSEQLGTNPLAHDAFGARVVILDNRYSPTETGRKKNTSTLYPLSPPALPSPSFATQAVLWWR